MNKHHGTTKRVRVFKNGRSRAVRLPKEFDVKGDEVDLTLKPDGTVLISRVLQNSLSDYLKTAEPWTGGDFVPDDSDLLPLDDVNL
ncbi:MAG: AbrB/MazE/SpoVT family DNA-binding domain-containing protein [Rhizobiaceae bacterium]|nr:AbrB/MazE/SpoVT family DNA-binding domain-containing protein [Rhizobiaceae bacterium]